MDLFSPKLDSCKKCIFTGCDFLSGIFQARQAKDFLAVLVCYSFDGFVLVLDQPSRALFNACIAVGCFNGPVFFEKCS